MAMATILIVFFFLFSLSYSHNVDFIFQGFRNTAPDNITLNGGASLILPNGALRLTNTSSDLIGRAFYAPPLQMFNNGSSVSTLNSFTTTFIFSIIPVNPNTGGGHGLAFIITPTKELRDASFSHYLGVLGPKNNGKVSNHIFIVEFDTVLGFGDFNDINDNHVGIDINSINSTVSESASYYVGNTNSTDKIELESGIPIQAWVEYDSVTMVVNVTIAPFSKPKPSKPLLSKKIDLSKIFKEQMYIGFSAATAKLRSSHYILAWSFRMNGVSRQLDYRRIPLPPQGKDSSRSKKGSVWIGVGVAATIFFITLMSCIYSYYLRTKRYVDILEGWELECSHRFPYKELYVATKGFKESEIIGSGGFGCVYKGVLPSTKEEVAIKKISHNSTQGIREFVAEISSLGQMRHRNLIQLHGWCKRRRDLLLVYDFMPNGSLADFLFQKNRPFLNWEQRFKILKGIASALLYLHQEWEQTVVHRDVKANNVLIDADMNGRLGDFGLARLYDHGKNPCTTHIVGTLGYMAPEISHTGKATTSCDVFSYGALLLEVACGRPPIDPNASPKSILLLDWVLDCWARGCVLEAADPSLNSFYPIGEMELVLKLGLVCSQKQPEARPTMRQVGCYLEGSDFLPTDLAPESLDVGNSTSGYYKTSSSSSLLLGIGVLSSGSFGTGR